MTIIETIVVSKGLFEENCYLIVCPETREGAVVDPGALGEREVDAILAAAAKHQTQIKAIINTHGHLDHIAGNRELQKRTGAKILIHTLDAPMLPDPQRNGSSFFGLSITSPEADRLLEDGEVILVGSVELRVAHTPGHTRGGICLMGDGFVFSGDTLFAQSIGRTDFPGGNEQQEMASILRHLFSLPNETVVYPGHGPQTNIAREKRSNPYFAGFFSETQAPAAMAGGTEVGSFRVSSGLSAEA